MSARGRATEFGSDSDALAVRAASRRVAIQLAVATTAIAVIALTLAFVFVLRRIAPSTLFGAPFVDHRITIGARDMLLGAIGGSVLAVALAGLMTIWLTRRAVRPLGDALRIQRSFVADASHELRTPLTVLDARLQIIQRMVQSGEQIDAELADLRDDARALIDIVNDLLAAAEVADPKTEERDVFEVGTAITSATASISPLASAEGIAIRGDVSGNLRVAIPETRLVRCLVILMDNAIKHSAPGSTITVSAWKKRSSIVIAVRDHGSGIRGIDPARVFDRFAHSEGDAVAVGMSGRRAGYGIGLALVRDTVVRFGGDVRVRESSPLGTTFELVFPSVRA